MFTTPTMSREGQTLDLENVGRELAQLRESRGLGQSELARRAGVAQSSISLIESGHRIPSFPTLVRLAEILNASICICHDDDEEDVED